MLPAGQKERERVRLWGRTCVIMESDVIVSQPTRSHVASAALALLVPHVPVSLPSRTSFRVSAYHAQSSCDLAPLELEPDAEPAFGDSDSVDSAIEPATAK